MGKETIRLKTKIFFFNQNFAISNGYVLLDVMNKQLQKQQKGKKYECN